MFKNMKLGTKIACGFSLLILLACILGGVAVWEMRDIQTETTTLAKEFVPEVKVANNIERHSLKTMYAMRGYGFTGDAYQNPVEYLFSRLNEVKPEMIEEATRNAREVASKFAEDSNSRLGKIRQASQGQFSIEPRDTNNPHIKKVRVVSTVEYYLAD